MTRTTPGLAALSPSFCTTSAGGHLAPVDLACIRPSYTAVLGWNRVSNLESSGTEIEIYTPRPPLPVESLNETFIQDEND
ncbi:hypothetical protein AVEN_33119-1 [Araneus ventricosus]|uniref:Uncharacterized protein n=1 Tax=Araneus ventricosus TaxID=182803 RepID=A0A4Y2TJC2_ARAVE|nr:hypothetical protein AVEN_33119-1 [Araneus ventricosus]